MHDCTFLKSWLFLRYFNFDELGHMWAIFIRFALIHAKNKFTLNNKVNDYKSIRPSFYCRISTKSSTKHIISQFWTKGISFQFAFVPLKLLCFGLCLYWCLFQTFHCILLYFCLCFFLCLCISHVKTRLNGGDHICSMKPLLFCCFCWF